MKQTLLLFLLIISFSASGQNHYFGFQSGINASNFSSDVLTQDIKYRIGISGGINYELLVKNKFSIGIDLLYSQLGYRYKLIFLPDETEEATVNNNCDYVSLPIKLGYIIGNRIKGFVKLGINTSVAVSFKVKSSEFKVDNEVYPERTLDYTNDIRRFDLGGLAELGSAIGLNDKFELTAMIGYRHSFTTFTSPTYFEMLKMRHYSFNSSLGLRYKLR